MSESILTEQDGLTKNKLALVAVEQQPFNAEAPIPILAKFPTPSSLFYVRNHFDVPRIDITKWQLQINGSVEQPLELSFHELKAMPQRSLNVTMECAGNGRNAMSPVPSGTPWGFGAVSTTEFTGTPLGSILENAGLRSDWAEVLFVGADRGEVEPGRVEPFARSLTPDVVRHQDTLLCWAMNGEPLLPEHGYPLRLVVPRWYGVASVKWLERISVLSKPFDGYYQKERYVYSRERGTPEGTRVSLMRVRSVITQPANGDALSFGPAEIQGTAWSGSGPINRVEVSADYGKTWTEATLGSPPSQYAATVWRLPWNPPNPGTYTLIARATDSSGNTQPVESLWNLYGYGNNVAHRIQVLVR